jgi:PhnB protein
MYLEGADSARSRDIFDALAAGSDPNVLDELREMPFGTYGHLADKYGIHWFFRGPHREES